ncbi:CocE/NonD family hydrolase [Streptomyces subrutilus]|uniref:CocE/NonD family hydrolase n=2 Tax=Streptomyces subrutilus TaxID=36818 RepID=UPI00343D4547
MPARAAGQVCRAAVPALLAASPYPRQLQDLGAPVGVIEAGAGDFWVPRGYAHVIANLRGTNGSGGSWGFFDGQERRDLYDLVEWTAAQPWCDGNVGMIGISYYAMAQLAAATQRPPHLKAVFPYDVSVSAWEAANHNGLLNERFATLWLRTVAVLAARGDRLLRRGPSRLARRVLAAPSVHGRFADAGGADMVRGLQLISRVPHAAHPWDDLLRAVRTEHPTRDAWWDERDLRPLLGAVDVPVYIGSEWTNVVLHLPGAFEAWDGLRSNPHVRMALLGAGGLPWPWESMHVEALAWFDHWLRGRDTGTLEGPPVRYWLAGADEWRTSATWPPPAEYVAYALGADGSLDPHETPGARQYAGDTRHALPVRLSWSTAPLEADLDMVGHLELRLTAATTGTDIGWIALLQDVAPDGSATEVTQGWLRGALREVDEEASRPGRPVLPQRHPAAVPPDETVDYRIPLVANARRFRRGHRIRLTLTTDDTRPDFPAMLGFTHAVVGVESINTVHSSSLLLLPVLQTRS